MKVLPLAYAVAAMSILTVGRLAAQAPDGQAIYRDECRTCHGAAGKPTQRAVSQYKNMPTLDTTFLSKRSQDSIVAVLNHGVRKDMKSFKDKLSPAEIAAVAKYVRETFRECRSEPLRYSRPGKATGPAFTSAGPAM